MCWALMFPLRPLPATGPRRWHRATLGLAVAATAFAGASSAAAHATTHQRAAQAVPMTARTVHRTHFRAAGQVSAPPRVRMRSWVVADADTGRILGAHWRNRKLPQASTIKLLTALTAADRVARFPRHRITRAEAHITCTCAGLVVGRRYSRGALMGGMLVPSGNDAAEALAGSDRRGRAAFIAAENVEAGRLGARNTWVVTPSGLTAQGAHSSAYDLAVFLRAAAADPVVSPWLDDLRATVGPLGGRSHFVYRGHDYIRSYPGSLGKSGFTTPAKNTLAVITEVGGHRLVVTTLGAPGGYSTSGTRALATWAADNFDRLGAVGQLPAVPQPAARQH